VADGRPAVAAAWRFVHYLRARRNKKTQLARLSEEMMVQGAGIDPQPAAAQTRSTGQTGKHECMISD
jgi:hypothetical protein